MEDKTDILSKFSFFLGLTHLSNIFRYSELEIDIKFPTCWDGVNVESSDQSHVIYAPECDGEANECFDLDCPASHPQRIPEIHLYIRVNGYEGGAHMFSNETDVSF